MFLAHIYLCHRKSHEHLTYEEVETKLKNLIMKKQRLDLKYET